MERKILRNSLGVAAALGIGVSSCAEISVAKAPPEDPEAYTNYVQVATSRPNRLVLPGIHLGSMSSAQPVVESKKDAVFSQEVPDTTHVKEPEVLQFWTGIATWYSRDGCVGCSENLLMANGEPLNDSALTVAFNYAPLGSSLKVTNLDNGRSVEVLVTDTGGFTEIGDGRIVDVTIAVKNALGISDMGNVKVELLND